MSTAALILAKATSTRVRDKNYRPFYRGESLVDILAGKLKQCFAPENVFLSCDDPTVCRCAANTHGIRPLPREARLAANETPFPEVIRGVCADVHRCHPGRDIMWCEPIDPMFNEHGKLLREWENTHRFGFDAMTVVYPISQYLLDRDHRPIGFGFGEWHTTSQTLTPLYRLNFTCAILTPSAIDRCGYVVGAKPAWYHATNPFTDIDTEEDFRIAQLIYAAWREGRL